MNARSIAVVIAALIALVGLWLVADRGGVIAWVALTGGVVLTAMNWPKPSKLNAVLVAGLAAVLIFAWVGVHRYVISTWESGEVVELGIETGAGIHTARLWILDIAGQPTLYYDAPPAAARSLLAGTPLQFTRAGKTDTRLPEATRAEELSDAETNRVLEAMGAKYGDRNDAANIWYLMLGRERDRVALVVRLIEG